MRNSFFFWPNIDQNQVLPVPEWPEENDPCLCNISAGLLSHSLHRNRPSPALLPTTSPELSCPPHCLPTKPFMTWLHPTSLTSSTTTPTLGHCSLLLVVPRSRHQTRGDRDFSVATPRLRNALPLHIHAAQSLEILKPPVKTHLFYLALIVLSFAPAYPSFLSPFFYYPMFLAVCTLILSHVYALIFFTREALWCSPAVCKCAI